MEASGGPDQPPEKHVGTETVRSLTVWVQCEGTGTMPDGSPARTVMTLDYDPARKKFVGTFVGSMMTHLWVYEGELDAAGKVLTLDADGPSCADPNKTARYKDAITFVTPDHRTLMSRFLGDDGRWHHFMTAHYRRKEWVAMRPQPLIAVSDVEASSRWYRRLLGCRSAHGGPEYERLVWGGELVMQLHRFDVGHHHGPIGDPDDRPYGNGVLLWFEVDDLDAAVTRAIEMKAEVVMPKHRNPPDGDGGPNHWEVWLRDPDGYTVVLASPDGSAG